MSGAEHKANRRRSVLIVTDTPEDLHVLEGQLGQAGYDLVRAWGAENALAVAHETRPDVVLLDVSSPQGSDVEFCKALRAAPETEAIPVVVIVGDECEDPASKVLDMGADGLLCRPFQPTELLTRIQTLVRMKDLHDKSAEQNRQLLQANVRLDQLNQELMRRNRELEQGMEMALRLHEALLPQQYPRVKNVSFSHKYAPAEAIGGDFFQLSCMEDGRAIVFIADVSGHGIRAALITAIVKTVIDYINPNDKTPSEVLKDFNSRFRSVLGPMTPQIYATGVLLMVDGENRRVAAACAGHPSPLHISKEAMTAEPLLGLDEYGPALGFLSDPEYPTVVKDVGAGDIILGFTDGVFEVLNEQREMFGLRRLQALVADNARLVPRDLIQRIISETEEFIGSAKRPDDICIVAVELD